MSTNTEDILNDILNKKINITQLKVDNSVKNKPVIKQLKNGNWDEIKFNLKYKDLYKKAIDKINSVNASKSPNPAKASNQTEQKIGQIYKNKATYNWSVVDSNTIQNEYNGNVSTYNKSDVSDPAVIKMFEELVAEKLGTAAVAESVESTEGDVDTIDIDIFTGKTNTKITELFINKLSEGIDFSYWLTDTFLPSCIFKNIYVKNKKLLYQLPPEKYNPEKHVYFSLTYEGEEYSIKFLNDQLNDSRVPDAYKNQTAFDIIEQAVVQEYIRRLKNTNEAEGSIFQRLKSPENNKIIKEYSNNDGWFYTFIEEVNYARKEIDAEFYFKFGDPVIKSDLIESFNFNFYRHREIKKLQRPETFIPIDFDFIKTELMNGYLYNMLSVFTIPTSFENIRKLAFKHYVDYTDPNDKLCKGDPDTDKISYTKGWGRSDDSTLTFKGRNVTNKLFKVSDNWRNYIEGLVGDFTGHLENLRFCDVPQIDVKNLKFYPLDFDIKTKQNRVDKDVDKRSKTRISEAEEFVKQHAENNPSDAAVTIYYANPIIVENITVMQKIDALSSKLLGSETQGSKSLFDPLKSAIRQPSEYLTSKFREYALSDGSIKEMPKMVYADMYYYNGIKVVKFNDTDLELRCNRIDSKDITDFDEKNSDKDRSYSIKFKEALTNYHLAFINDARSKSLIDKIVCDYIEPKQKEKNDKKKKSGEHSPTLFDIHTSSDFHGKKDDDKDGKKDGKKDGDKYGLKNYVKAKMSFKYHYDDKTGQFDDDKTKYFYDGMEFDGNNICRNIPIEPSKQKTSQDIKDEIKKKFITYVKKQRDNTVSTLAKNISQPVDYKSGWWYSEPKFNKDGSIDILNTKIFYNKDEVDPEIIKYLSSLYKTKVHDGKVTIIGEIDPVDAYYSFGQILSLKLTEHYKEFYDAQNIFKDKTIQHVRALKTVKTGFGKEVYNRNTCKLLDDEGSKSLDPINGWWYDTVDIVQEELTYKLYYKGRNIPKNLIKRCDKAKVKALEDKIIADFISKNPEYSSRIVSGERNIVSQTRRVVSKTINNIYSGIKGVSQYGQRKVRDISYAVGDIIGV